MGDFNINLLNAETCNFTKEFLLTLQSYSFIPAIDKPTRRLAACTQAVVILRSTSYIAIELKCSVFEVMRNSIESMCSSYTAFDCISWNRLIAYYSFTGPLPRKMSQDHYVSLWTFQSIFFSLCRCCLFVCFISQTRETF